MPAGFTQGDRDRLIRLETASAMTTKEVDRRFEKLEEQDEVLHRRISDMGKALLVTDRRLDKIRNIFSGVVITANAAWAGFLIFLKLVKP